MNGMRKAFRFPFKVNALFVRILSYFLSLLIPTLIISAVYYVNFIQNARSEFAGKMALHLRSIAATTDLNLGTVTAANLSLLSDETVGKLLKPSDRLTDLDRANLPRLIETINRTNTVVSSLADNVYMYIDKEKVYTSQGVDQFDSFFAKSYRYAQFDKVDWQSKLNSGSPIEILPKSDVSVYGIARNPVVPLLTKGLVRGHQVVVVANLSTSMLRRAFSENNLFPATQYLVADANGNIVFHSDGMSGQVAEDLIRSTDKIAAQGDLESEGMDYMATYDKAPVYGWHFYSLTPVGEFNRQAAGLRMFILLICSALLVVGFAFSFVFTFRLYNPIKKIHDVLVSGDAGQEAASPHSGKNDLWRIGAGVYRLQQANEQYRNKLALASNERLEHEMLYLLQGSGIPDEPEMERLLSAHFGFRSADYSCCAVFFEFKEKFYKDFQDVDRINILTKMTRLIGGLLKVHIPAFVFEYSTHMYVCILNANGNESQDRVSRALNNLLKVFEYDALFCEIHIGVGRAYPKLADIHKSYNEAMTALQNRNVQLDFQINYSQSLDIENRYYYSHVDENKILNYLRKGDLDTADNAMREVLRKNESRNVSHSNIQLLLFALYHTALRYGTERKIDYNELVSEEEHLMLSGITQPAADADAKLEMVIRLCRQLSERSVDSNGSEGSMVEAIIAYIEKNYSKDIYLDTIAQEVGVSPKYVSRLFKEKTGTNLTDYISMFRVEKAKELLLATGGNVNDIALNVGIYSRATFQRLFKKYEGVSPNEFRKTNRK